MPLPDFLICGAGKSGTTTLWAVLKRHPDIFMSTVKDIAFFASDVAPNSSYEKGLDWYQSLFANASLGQIRGEASAAYLFDPETPQLIQSNIPDARLIFIFRDPSSRAYSHYWQEARKGEDLPSFDEVVAERKPPFDRIVRTGLYGTHLKRYLSYFSREQILCLRYEALRERPETLYSEICTFLRVDFERLPKPYDLRKNPSMRPRSKWVERVFFRTPWITRLGATLLPRSLHKGARTALQSLKSLNQEQFRYPPMAPESRHQLQAIFKPEVETLEDILGWDLSTWKGCDPIGITWGADT